MKDGQEEMGNIRTRFAPSPTGYLHIGGVRTALFNWLYARHNNGTYVLRIEDTDRARSSEEAVTTILESLQWLGLDWDEGPFFQSERLPIYSRYAEQLLKEEKAYYSETDEQGRRALIFRIPHETVVLKDLIYGNIEFDNALIKDLVIIKSDGMPTYNFACTIDDALMNITHIIRGDDHISNTPKQIPLYEALGFDLPHYAHVPMILGEDKARLSKRHGATSVTYYKDEGYLREALNNYLLLLGWSPGDDREIFSGEEMIREFTLDKVSKKSAVFSIDKLSWMNGMYIRKEDRQILYDRVHTYLIAKGAITDKYDKNTLNTIIDLFKDRVKVINDFFDMGDFFFVGKIDYSEELCSKFIMKDGIINALEIVRDRINELSNFDENSIEELCRTINEECGLKTKHFFQSIRIALTGKTVSPGLFETMVVLGKDTVLQRLENLLNVCNESCK